MTPTEPTGSTDTTRPGALSARQRAESLKERVYISFTSLAVVLALQSHADETTPVAAAATLSIVVVGSLLGIFVADLLSHLTVHGSPPTREELHHMVTVSAGALGVLVVPLLLLTAAGLGLWTTAVALRWAIVVLAVTLFVIGYLAIRQLKLPVRHKAVILLAEVLLGLLVIGLELLAHSL